MNYGWVGASPSKAGRQAPEVTTGSLTHGMMWFWSGLEEPVGRGFKSHRPHQVHSNSVGVTCWNLLNKIEEIIEVNRIVAISVKYIPSSIMPYLRPNTEAIIPKVSR